MLAVKLDKVSLNYNNYMEPRSKDYETSRCLGSDESRLYNDEWVWGFIYPTEGTARHAVVSHGWQSSSSIAIAAGRCRCRCHRPCHCLLTTYGHDGTRDELCHSCAMEWCVHKQDCSCLLRFRICILFFPSFLPVCHHDDDDDNDDDAPQTG